MTAESAMHRVRMRDLVLHVPGDGYEDAVMRLEAWCIDNDVDRRGAEFDALPDDERCNRCGMPGVEVVHLAPSVAMNQERGQEDR